MQRTLIVIGLALLVAGLAWPWISRLPFGRLPGDFSVERENFSFFFPLATSIVVSIVTVMVVESVAGTSVVFRAKTS